MKKDICILLFVLITIIISCRVRPISDSSMQQSDESYLSNQYIANEFLGSIIDSCHLYWQEDSVITILTFTSYMEENLNVYIGYSYNYLPFVSKEFKDIAIQSGFLDAEKFRTIDDFWGYWTIVNDGKTNFVFVCGENKDDIPRSVLNVDMLQDIHVLHHSVHNTVYYGGGHVKQYEITHRNKDSVLSKSTPAQEILFQKVSPDVVFD